MVTSFVQDNTIAVDEYARWALLRPGVSLVLHLSGRLHYMSRPWTTRRAVLKGAALRVLVVDDNHNAAVAMVAYLDTKSIEARAVFGGLEAIDTARATAPHVILMDLNMPLCDGFEATRTLRRDPNTNHFVIIAHTALDETEVRRHQADSDGFDGYVQKGQPLGQLIALIQTLTA